MQTTSGGYHFEECRALSSFHRRGSRLKQAFIGSLCNFAGLGTKRLQFEKHAGGSNSYRLQGLFLVLDHRGRKVYSQFVEVQYVQGDGVVSFSVRLRPEHSTDRLQFVWAKNGRWKRIKEPKSKLNKTRKKKEAIKRDCLGKSGQSPTLVLNWSKKGREGYRHERHRFNSSQNKQADVAPGESKDPEDEDVSEEEDSDFPEDPPRRRPYVKALKGSAINYLLGSRVKKRSSKLRRRDLEDLKFATSSPSCEYSQLDHDIDGDDNCSRQRGAPTPTFGDYCSFPLSRQRAKGERSVKDKRKGDNTTKSSGQFESSNFETQPRKTVADDEGRVGAPESTAHVSARNFAWVRLSRAQARPDVLSSEFKLDYREAPCKPRRFVLNVSRLLYQHVVLQTRLRTRLLPMMDLSTYLVFTFLRAADDDDEVDEYRLTINSAWTEMPVGRILTELAPAKKCSRPIQEILHVVTHAIDKAHLRRLKVRRDAMGPEKPAHPVCLFNMVARVAHWETVSLSLPYTTEWCENISSDLVDSRSKRDIVNEIVGVLTKGSDELRACNNVGPSSSNLCGICLSEIGSRETSDSQPFLLALTYCSHWFCEECWKSRVLLDLRHARRPDGVPCPERACPSRLDPVTLLSVFPVSDVRKINAIKVENYVMTSRALKMCPNSACHRLILSHPRGAPSRTAVIVTCECGSQVCFECLLSPHWPASCGVAKAYHKRLRARSDEVLDRLLTEREFPEVVRRGKKCPRCGVFILQSSSKKNHVCSCGCQFCWPCGKSLAGNDGSHRECVETFHHSDKILKEIVNNTKPGGERAYQVSRWYGTAQAHRKMRHPEVVVALYSMAESIAQSVSNFHQGGHYVGDVSRAAEGWGRRLKVWALENYEKLQSTRNSVSGDDARSLNEDSAVTYSRSLSTSSTSSVFSEPSWSSPSIHQAAENIVQMKLELHHITEYTAVLLDTAASAPAKLAQCLERAEDLCTATGLLLQNAQNCRQVLPAFLRVQAKARQIIGQILTIIEETPSGVFSTEEDGENQLSS